MKRRVARSDMAFDAVNILIMVLLAFITLYPMYYVLISSISSGEYVSRGAIRFIPRGLTLSSYKMIVQDDSFIRGLLNTIVYTVTGTCVNLAMSILCAYPLSVKTFSGRNFFVKMIMFTMFFSGGMIPLYLVIKSLKMIDTIWALILPGAISTYNMIVIRTFFQNIAGEMRESAFIDGANDFTIMTRIMVPLSMPVLATMMLFYATGHWNNFMNALLYITKKELYPIQLILRNLLITDEMSNQYADMVSEFSVVPATLKYSSIVIATLPILCVYPYLQRYFVKGVMIGSLKG